MKFKRKLYYLDFIFSIFGYNILLITLLVILPQIICSQTKSQIEFVKLFSEPKINWFAGYIGKQKFGYFKMNEFISNENGYETINIEIIGKFDFGYEDELNLVMEFESIYQFSTQDIPTLLAIKESYFYEEFKSGVKTEYSEYVNKSLRTENGTYVILSDVNGNKTEVIGKYFPVQIFNFAPELLISDNKIINLIGKERICGVNLDTAKPFLCLIKDFKSETIKKNGKDVNRIIITDLDSYKDPDENVSISIFEGNQLLEFEMMDLRFVLESSEEAALKNYNPLKINETKILPLKKYFNTLNMDEINITISGEKVEEFDFSNHRQVVIKKDNNSIKLRLKKDYDYPISSSDDINYYLKSNDDIPLYSNELIELNPITQNILIELGSFREIADYLNNFVYNYLDYERTSFSSLKEIIISKKGDCSEFSTLLVALARLNNIPARKVGGYAYNYDIDTPAFEAHAWVELFIDGKWFEYDPTWNLNKLALDHIRESELTSFENITGVSDFTISIN